VSGSFPSRHCPLSGTRSRLKGLGSTYQPALRRTLIGVGIGQLEGPGTVLERLEAPKVNVPS
jgi:hypothetical protein